MSRKNDILLAFYGDDFTGSTDALEFITRAGARTILFTETPTPQQLDSFEGLKAFGVAGKTRALDPGAMQQLLLPAFEELKASGARQVHYKICSTFDSSPQTGSIGKAIDCGATVFGNRIVPVLGGMPALGRYCVFGNLFARMGIGSKGKIYRLDRHPSMSKHPVTPSDESDLRLHIGRQTSKKIGLLDILQLEKPVQEWNELVEEEVVLLDALNETQLEKIGEWMDAQPAPLFSVGSSGIELALGKTWQGKGLLQPATAWASPGKAVPLLVVSGSCSPVTASQIAWARANGFEELELDGARICNEEVIDDAILQQVKDCLSQQKNLVVHTGVKQDRNLPAEKLGTALGTIAKAAVIQPGVKRVVVSGGDTSSYAARALEVDAVEMIAPLTSGAPLCRVYSANKAIDGLEINFKGGQVGGERYFGEMGEGRVKC